MFRPQLFVIFFTVFFYIKREIGLVFTNVLNVDDLLFSMVRYAPFISYNLPDSVQMQQGLGTLLIYSNQIQNQNYYNSNGCHRFFQNSALIIINSYQIQFSIFLYSTILTILYKFYNQIAEDQQMAQVYKGGKKQNPLFTIDIKISGQILSVPVFEGQNHESLIKRFCDQHLLKSDYKDAVKSKIIEALLTTIKKAQISSSLKQKVNNFLNQNQSTIRSKTKSIKQLKNRQNQSTPFKLLQSQNNSSLRKNSANRHVGGHLQEELNKKSLKNLEVKQNIRPAAIRKNKAQPQKISKQINTTNQSKYKVATPKAPDADLIAAYQTIYRKSKQPHMKKMARKFLQQCGHLKMDHPHINLNKKSIQPNSIFNKIHLGSPEKNLVKVESKHNSSSPNKRKVIEPMDVSIINNVSKMTQPFQLSKQKRDNFQQSKQVSNRQKVSISYIREAQLKCEDKYKNQVPDYSRYSNEFNRSPYRSQKASISYQRLPPHNHPDIIYDQRSSFRYLGQPQPQRSISLRRTRKYKYL